MKLNVKRTIYVGLAFGLISLFWSVYDAVIPKILINSFGLDQTASGFVMAFDNILALFLLPLFGTLSDRTNTKWGRRTPYIVIGTIVAALLITGVAIFDAIQLNALALQNIEPVTIKEFIGTDGIISVTEQAAYDAAWAARQAAVWQVTQNNILYLILFIGMLFLVLVAMATYRSPAVALMPDVTVKPLRSKANAIINLMGTAGGILSMGLVAVLSRDFQSYVLLFGVVAIAMVILLVIFLWKVNEPKLVEIRKQDATQYGIEEEVEVMDGGQNDSMSKEVRISFYLILISVFMWFMGYNAATTKFSMYAQTMLGIGYSLPLITAQAAAVVSFVPIGIIASKVGRRKTILAGIIMLTVAFILGYTLNPSSAYLVYVVMALAGIGWATINVNSYPMVVEMSKGSDVGKYTGYYYTASMAAQIVTPIFSGFLMDQMGNMSILFPYSAFFCVVAFITMFFVRHGDSKPIPTKSKLESFQGSDD